MYLKALWEIKGEISLNKFYKEEIDGWRPPQRNEWQICVKNDKNLKSNYDRRMFIDIKEWRMSKIDEILNSNLESND